MVASGLLWNSLFALNTTVRRVEHSVVAFISKDKRDEWNDGSKKRKKNVAGSNKSLFVLVMNIIILCLGPRLYFCSI